MGAPHASTRDIELAVRNIYEKKVLLKICFGFWVYGKYRRYVIILAMNFILNIFWNKRDFCYHFNSTIGGTKV